MARPKADGRMIRKDISNSKKFAALSMPARVLFTMLIPHFNSHGKLNGGVGYIKDEVCPFIPEFTYDNLPGLLQEINDKTNVKWFEHNGRRWLHSLHFLTEHQDLRTDRQGMDELPDYSRTTPGLLPPEVEVEVEVEVEREGKSGLARAGLQGEKLETEPVTTSPPASGTHPPSREDWEQVADDRAAELNAHADHSWQEFKQLMPLRNGKFIDEDECRLYWARHPALWSTWIFCVKNYRASREVRDGLAYLPMNFLVRKYVNWHESEKQPLGGNGEHSARDALRAALLDKTNICMPKLPLAAEALFREKGISWPILQQQVQSDPDSL